MKPISQFEDERGIVIVPVSVQRIFVDAWFGFAHRNRSGSRYKLEALAKSGHKDLITIHPSLGQQFTQRRPRFVFPMIEEQSTCDRASFENPIDQFALVGVCRVVTKPADSGSDLEVFPVNPNFFLRRW